MGKPQLPEAVAQALDLLRNLEYMNRVWWPWGGGEDEKVIKCGSTTIIFREPLPEAVIDIPRTTQDDA